MANTQKRIVRLTYDMGQLGKETFEFESVWPDRVVDEFKKKNPPGPTVINVFLETPFSIQPYENPSFDREIYEKAVGEKIWREEYFKKTGNHWQDKEERKNSSESIPETDTEERNMDVKTCLKLFGLNQDFSEKELKAAYRKAVRENHPDKVASLAEEFKNLAERKTKQINQAYDTLLNEL